MNVLLTLGKLDMCSVFDFNPSSSVVEGKDQKWGEEREKAVGGRADQRGSIPFSVYVLIDRTNLHANFALICPRSFAAYDWP